MGKKSILIAFIVLVFLTGCSSIMKKGYVIKESSSKNWRFTGGELILKGGEEEITYSIDYIGNDEFKPSGLTFEFLICPKDSNKSDVSSAEHLHSNINGYTKVDNKYSNKDSFKGKLLDLEKEYDFEYLYLKISYEADGIDHEEVIKLSMEPK